MDAASWVGFPPDVRSARRQAMVGYHAPSFSLTFVLLVLPAVIALIAENTGHVKAVAEMTGATSTRTWAARSRRTASAPRWPARSAARPTTTYAENIGVMAATRVYSTAAYYVAAVVAILLRPLPEVRRAGVGDAGRRARRHHRRPLRHDRPARRQDLDGEPGRLRQPGQPGAAGRGHHHRHRRRELADHDNFSLSGIALGTIVAVGGWHLARVLAPAEMRDGADAARVGGASVVVDAPGAYVEPDPCTATRSTRRPVVARRARGRAAGRSAATRERARSTA